MISTLYIENIAVIEECSIDFNPGLNVLTGETGAGKSIIIDAINAIMGQRTSKDIIRTGAASAFVSICFENINGVIKQKLADLGFDDGEDTLILQRTLSAAGKNTDKLYKNKKFPPEREFFFCDQSMISTETFLPFLWATARIRMRICLTILPLRPMTLPISPSATRTSKMISPSALRSVTETWAGSSTRLCTM